MNINVISLIITLVIFTDIYVFCFSVLVSIGLQDSVWCDILRNTGQPQSYVTFSTLEFLSCFFVFDGTHTAPIYLTLHKPLAVVSVKSFFLTRGWIPQLAVTNAQWRRVLLTWGVPLGPPISLWTTGTVSRQFALSVHCVKFVSVTSSVPLSVSMSLRATPSSDECLSGSDYNISSVMSHSTWFLLVVKLVNVHNSAHNKYNAY